LNGAGERRPPLGDIKLESKVGQMLALELITKLIA
jgi:hypothetical protein